MREIRTSGSMSGDGKRVRWQLERDTEPKGPEHNSLGSLSLNSYRARPRLYPRAGAERSPPEFPAPPVAYKSARRRTAVGRPTSENSATGRDRAIGQHRHDRHHRAGRARRV